MQNAGKHAGPGATLSVEVTADADALHLTVHDDGVGFAATSTPGAGFVNMTDRLSAIGGTLTVHSAPGAGTTISAAIPAARPPAPAGSAN
jgi:signal transduction histidine kinase